MRSGIPRLVFASAFVLNGFLWSQSRYGHVASSNSHSVLSKRGGVVTRSLFGVRDDEAFGVSRNGSLTLVEDTDCRPIAFPTDEQCQIAEESCPYSDTVLSIPYLQRYYCSKPPIRPFIFAGYILWLAFLFSTLGISASDFFCHNLGTLAQLLGLDENVAGVTFLAFGNGSPDVFATFSAMKNDSGGLAIGELLGAASFVTTVVVGSMCIIKPFRADPGPFLRDVGFFTVAIIVLLVVLWDSQITAMEAASLVVMYVFYVTVVVVGSWWERRRERKRQLEAMLRDEYREEVAPYQDEPESSPTTQGASTSGSLLQLPYTRSRAISAPQPHRPNLELPERPQTRSPSPNSTISKHHRHSSHSSHYSHMPSFSLVGALEFRDLVSKMQRHASGPSLDMFDSPISPYPGGHYSYHGTLRGSRPHTPQGHDHERDPFDLIDTLPLHERSPPHGQGDPLIEISSETENEESPVPPIAITHTPASPTEASDAASSITEQVYGPPQLLSKRQRIWHVIVHSYHVLFPSLQGFRQKSLPGKIAGLFAAPAIMALTLTLPVVVTDFDNCGEHEEKHLRVQEDDSARLIEFEEEGVQRALVAEEEIEKENEEKLKFNKWLMAVQCILGPLFCVSILFDGTEHEPWLLLAAGVSGTTLAILVAVFAKDGTSPGSRLVRCTMGFIVAVVWIMAIADEVVEVLKTFGLIFGLSDAIIGITIFAMGNSLADLVANMSVAVFAPVMGFSACFGGPMLNILLGIGISGSYIIRQTGEPYHMHFSTTLVVTATGLLALLVVTLLFVPYNGYFLPRTWGFALIAAYTALMIANVVVEVKHKSTS
ncbi:hypothetical protein K474DRAFT_1661136 [Panus rudis PR-1116 ss-1]|nr:hypothetical protein K474DRAFT_1661136 [Panus rudis PR-1116 ss-1]